MREMRREVILTSVDQAEAADTVSDVSETSQPEVAAFMNSVSYILPKKPK